MKQLILAAILMVTTNSAFADLIKSSDEKVSISSVSEVIRLVDKNTPGSSHKKLSITVTDGGMSTDMSPRFAIYLSYASLAEMGNIFAEFKITDKVFQFKSAARLAAGVYQVSFTGFDENYNLKETVLKIDARKMFVDEVLLRNNCGGDFCDKALSSSIIVTEVK